jgi:hypothetical protein
METAGLVCILGHLRKILHPSKEGRLKPRDLHEVPGGIDELKSFVGVTGRPPLPVCSSVIVEVRDAEKPNTAQNSDVLTGAFPEEGSQGPEVVEVGASPMLRWIGAVVLCFAAAGYG